jgi:hypothetical protein
VSADSPEAEGQSPLPTHRWEPYHDPRGHAGPGWYVMCMSGCLAWPDGPYATVEDARSGTVTGHIEVTDVNSTR